MTVLVIGEALVDVVQQPGAEPEPHAGGSPFNVAVGLARLGVPTLLACQLADDEHGALLRERLDGSGAELVALDPQPTRTSTALATIADDGSAAYDFDLVWNPAHLPDPGEFDAVHVGSLGTSLHPGAGLVASLVASADALGVPVSYDPNIRLAVEPEHEFWRGVFAAIAPHARIIKMSDEDAAVLFPDEDPQSIAARFATGGVLVAITLGGDGAVIAGGGQATTVDAPHTQVADTIGAGDSFMAAMLAWSAAYAWPSAEELDVTELADLATYAVQAAAVTVGRPGADPPWTEELTA